jgi:hypothetical protein
MVDATYKQNEIEKGGCIKMVDATYNRMNQSKSISGKQIAAK